MLSLNFWNVLFTLINLLVLYLLMKKFLFGPISAVMEERRQMIDTSVADAEKQKQEAYQLKAEYEKSITEADDAAAQILAKARKDADAIYEKKMKDADESIAKMKIRADEELKSQKELAMDEVKDSIASLAMAAAIKVMGDADPTVADEALYETFLKEGMS